MQKLCYINFTAGSQSDSKVLKNPKRLDLPVDLEGRDSGLQEIFEKLQNVMNGLVRQSLRD